MAEVLPSDELVEEPSDYGSMGPSKRLGRYELLVPIARGGMARVWAARLHGHHGFQKLVAIKTILPHLAVEAEFQRMFLDEARIASCVHHPNVCEIYELGEEGQTLYLAMEWVSGDSFARVLRAGGKTEAIDSRVVARIVADACAGVHAAHELTDEDGRAMGVVHRDLSPHNILLTADGTAKVADFGVAKALGQLHEATSAGQLKGKIAYMAPEQVTGSGIDRRSDVFSLGCVIYEATTGQRPFRGDGDHQVMHAVLKGEVALPTTLLRGYPQELERIVMRALSPQPILRYPTAERMRFALEEFLARGQLITQANVAHVVRARIGEQIEHRKERIRQATFAGDREEGWSEPPGNMTPSNQQRSGGHRSGVKPSGALAGRPPGPAAQMPAAGVAPASGQQVGDGWNETTLRQGRDLQAVPQDASPYAQAPLPQGRPGAPQMQAMSPMQPMQQGAPMQHGMQQMQPMQPMPMQPMQHGMQQMQPMPMQPMQPMPMQPMQHGMQQMQPMQPMPMPMQPMPLQPMQGPISVAGQPAGIPSDARPAPAERPSAPPAGAGQYVAAIGVGVMLAALIGIGGFLAWRGRHVPAAGGGGSSPTAVAARDSATSTSAPDRATQGPASAPVPTDIVFRVVPAQATLSVDGQESLGDVRTMPRPAMGKTSTLVARANGHEDATIFVDFFTRSPLEITLKPLAGGTPSSVEPTPPTAGTGEAAKDPPKDPPRDAPKDPPKDPPKKEPRVRQPARDPGLPPNPF